VSPPPQGFFALPELPKDIFGQAFLVISNLNAENFIDWIAVLFVFLFVDIFDTIGTLTGVGMRAGYIGPDGELPRAHYSQVKLKTLLSMSNLTHFLPVDPIKI
ncbi:MAG TPA: hypothetical protein VER14_00295, partial [Phototrophicaceae bacterium]|nr:hypothetical protein [Phototrophicaceae bacterium]